MFRRKRATSQPPQNVYQQRQPRKSDPYATNRPPLPPSHENPQLGRHDGNEYACILEMPLPPPPPGANVEMGQEAGDSSFYESNQREPPTLQRLQRHYPPQSHLQDSGYPPLPVFDNCRDGITFEEDPRYFELDPDNVIDNNCHPAPGFSEIMNQRVMEDRDKHAARYSN